MKKPVIAGCACVLILYIVVKSDTVQEEFFPQRFYPNKIEELKEELKKADYGVYLLYEIFKDMESSRYKNYVEYLQLFRQAEPKQSFDSAAVKAQKQVSQNMLIIQRSLQDAVDKRNKINRELQNVKKQWEQYRRMNQEETLP